MATHESFSHHQPIDIPSIALDSKLWRGLAAQAWRGKVSLSELEKRMDPEQLKLFEMMLFEFLAELFGVPGHGKHGSSEKTAGQPPETGTDSGLNEGDANSSGGSTAASEATHYNVPQFSPDAAYYGTGGGGGGGNGGDGGGGGGGGGGGDGQVYQRVDNSGSSAHSPYEGPLPTPIGHLPTNVEQAKAFFFTEFASDWNVNGPGWSKDCGPASTAMAMIAFGFAPPGVDPHDPNAMMQAVRALAPGDQYFDTARVAQAAHAVGMTAHEANTIPAIDQALAQGQMVVLGGTCSGFVNDFKWTTNDYAQGEGGGIYQGEHMLLIAGVDQSTQKYVVCDPNGKRGPLELSRDQVYRFLTAGRGGGMALGA